MSFEVKVPAVGESITEGILTVWEKKNGEFVEVDEPLFELETDKVTMTINAEQSGTLQILVETGSTVEIGQVVATIRTGDAAPGERAPAAEPPPPAKTPTAPAATPPKEASRPAAEAEMAPSVRRLVTENELDPRQIQGSGREGRITKGDVLDFLEARKNAPEKVASAPSAAPAASETPAPTRPEGNRPQTRIPLSSIRKRIAERLVESQQTTATLTTFNEVDMTNVMAWRARYKDTFKEKYSVGLGFMSFFVKATIDALQAVPQFNTFLDGDEIVQNHYYDIGIAVGTERGLVVPVLRQADRLSFARIEERISDLARRAQEKKLKLEELEGGCFTISNGGVYGSLLSTPILNPPQTGILGMHGIKRRPVAIDDQIVIRPMMYLAVSYDHRLVDGRESVTFLRRIVECIENPERMLLEI